MQGTEICGTVVKELVTIVTSRVNQPGSERLRSWACRSLIHLEDFAQVYFNSVFFYATANIIVKSMNTHMF